MVHASMHYTDAFFGIVASVIRESANILQTPFDVMKLIEARIGPMVRARGEEFKIVYVPNVRNFEAMMPNVVDLSGAYRHRDGIEAPHNFMFTTRKWMTESALENAEQKAPYVHADHPDDVFVLVRQWVSDEELSQPPLLVGPHSLFREIEKFWTDVCENPIIMHRWVDESRAAGLKAIATFLTTYGDFYAEAIEYLRKLATIGDRPHEPIEQLGFILHGQRRIQGRGMPDLDQGPVHEDFIPKRLNVTFLMAGRGLAVADVD